MKPRIDISILCVFAFIFGAVLAPIVVNWAPPPDKIVQSIAPPVQTTVRLKLSTVPFPLPEKHIVYMWPIHKDDYIELSSPYGERNPKEIGGYGDDFHNGIDLFGTWNSRIISIADGKVIDVWPAPNGYYKGHKILGGCIRIRHNNNTISVYGHLSSTDVHEGDIIKAGDYIGRQGNTGRSQNDHLHFELLIDGKNVNPLKYIEEPK